MWAHKPLAPLFALTCKNRKEKGKATSGIYCGDVNLSTFESPLCSRVPFGAKSLSFGSDFPALTITPPCTNGVLVLRAIWYLVCMCSLISRVGWYCLVNCHVGYRRMLRVVYIMDHEGVPCSSNICDWLLNLSQDHFGLHQEKIM